MRPQFFWACGLLHRGCVRVFSVWQLDKWVIAEREQEGSDSAFQRAGFDISTARLCNASFILVIGNNLLKTVVTERGTRLRSLKGGLSKNLWACFKITMIPHLHYSLALLYTWLVHWFSPWQRHEFGGNASIPSLWVSKVITCSWVVVIGECQPKRIHL